MDEKPRKTHNLEMGLGDAVRRLMELEIRMRNGTRPNDKGVVEERNMLLDSLNHVQIGVGLSCTEEDLPKGVEVFKKAARTSCCRIDWGEGDPQQPEPQQPDPDQAQDPPKRGFFSRIMGKKP